jgi:hypothetical protein
MGRGLTYLNGTLTAKKSEDWYYDVRNLALGLRSMEVGGLTCLS